MTRTIMKVKNSFPSGCIKTIKLLALPPCLKRSTSDRKTYMKSAKKHQRDLWRHLKCGDLAGRGLFLRSLAKDAIVDL